MARWENLEDRESLQSQWRVPGLGWTGVHAKYLELPTWEPIIDYRWGQIQFAKFVEAIMLRIRASQSNAVEIRNFVNLLASETNWNYYLIAERFIPELKKDYIEDDQHFQMALLFQQLKIKIDQNFYQELGQLQEAPATYENGLPKCDKEFLTRQLFTNKEEAPPKRFDMNYLKQQLYARGEIPPRVERLAGGAVDIGFPRAAVERKVQEAMLRGTDIERDDLGLPTGMLMPGQPLSPGLWRPIPNPNTESSHIASSLAISAMANVGVITDNNANESPRPGLLTQGDVIGNVGPCKQIGRARKDDVQLPNIVIPPIAPIESSNSTAKSSSSNSSSFTSDATTASTSACSLNQAPSSTCLRVAIAKWPERSPTQLLPPSLPRDRASPILDYLQKLPRVPYKASPQGPIYPKGTWQPMPRPQPKPQHVQPVQIPCDGVPHSYPKKYVVKKSSEEAMNTQPRSQQPFRPAPQLQRIIVKKDSDEALNIAWIGAAKMMTSKSFNQIMESQVLRANSDGIWGQEWPPNRQQRHGPEVLRVRDKLFLFSL